MEAVSFTLLIEELSKPSFYPYPVRENIQIIHTHISTIILTGEFAYKIKKPVQFGFLDFSTLEKRKFYLEEELRLNKMISPEIYLEVLKISNSSEGLKLNSSGEAVDYVLKMIQFPQRGIFSNLISNDGLNDDIMKNLGRLVARFHKSADTNLTISEFGKLEKLKLPVDENFSQTSKYIGDFVSESSYKNIKNYSYNFLLKNSKIFQERIGNSKIKECHGDLHLGNICLWNGKIFLFDRIEFNEAFRFVDTMHDIAFTIMDLDANQKPDLANIFLNTYLEESGDYEGILVLQFYLVSQAFIRAKVNSFISEDPQINEEQKFRSRNLANNYYKLSEKYTLTSNPRLYVMSGISGSGKSTVGRFIAKQKNCIHIRSDVIRKHLGGIELSKKGDDVLYSPDMTEKTYQKIFEIAKLVIQSGYSVVLDAKYDKSAFRNQVFKYAEEQNLKINIIYCFAPMEQLISRLKNRKNDVSDASPELLEAQSRSFESFSVEEKSYFLELDTSKDNYFEIIEDFIK